MRPENFSESRLVIGYEEHAEFWLPFSATFLSRVSPGTVGFSAGLPLQRSQNSTPGLLELKAYLPFRTGNFLPAMKVLSLPARVLLSPERRCTFGTQKRHPA